MAQHPLTGITREIAEAISACVRNTPGAHPSVGDMAKAVAKLPAIAQPRAGAGMSDLFMRRTATISPCGRYRYWLEREWAKGKAILVVCMLNPSTADAERDDPTMLALIHFAKLWGYGGLVVVNLYAWRSPSPAAMMREPFRQTELNRLRGREAMIMAASIGMGRLLVAWGNDGDFEGEATRFADFAADQVGVELICLGITGSGAPTHPAARGKHRVPRDQQPIVWRTAK